MTVAELKLILLPILDNVEVKVSAPLNPAVSRVAAVATIVSTSTDPETGALNLELDTPWDGVRLSAPFNSALNDTLSLSNVQGGRFLAGAVALEIDT